MSEYIDILNEKDLPLVFVVPQAYYDTYIKSKEKYSAIETKIETNTELKDVEQSKIKNIGDFSDDQDQFVNSTEKEASEQAAQSETKDQENLFRKYPELRYLKQAIIKIENKLVKDVLKNENKTENVIIPNPLRETMSSASSITNETLGSGIYYTLTCTANSLKTRILTSSDEQNRERNQRLGKK